MVRRLSVEFGLDERGVGGMEVALGYLYGRPSLGEQKSWGDTVSDSPGTMAV